MKATLNLAENTILMDCTPQELAGLLSLLQPCPKQSLPSSDHHPDEPPAPAEPVQDPEPEPQAPELAPAEPARNRIRNPHPKSPNPSSPPEPAEREPLGKAIKRLREEERLRKQLQDDGRHYKYRPVYARNDDGDVIYCDSVAEMAIKLGVTAQCVNQAIRKNHYCKGYKIKEDDPKTML